MVTIELTERQAKMIWAEAQSYKHHREMAAERTSGEERTHHEEEAAEWGRIAGILQEALDLMEVQR